jgi:hypothetical protein
MHLPVTNNPVTVPTVIVTGSRLEMPVKTNQVFLLYAMGIIDPFIIC